MTELLITITKILAGLFLGILGGNGAVYAFNHVPASWLCDYGEDPWKVDHPNATDRSSAGPDDYIPQRIKSHPYKLAFSMLLCVAYVWLFAANPVNIAIPSCIALWLLLLIAIADRKYMIIPDQFTVFLAITAIGFIPKHMNFLEPLWGALLGGGSMLLVSLIGRLIFKKESLGFGDVKLFAAIGLSLGLYGTAIVLVGTSFLSCIVYMIRLLRKKISKGDAQPLADIIALVCSIYILLDCYGISYLPGL